MIINPILEEIYRTEPVIRAFGEDHQAVRIGIPQSLAETLYHLIRENSLKQTLEIGMAFGLSTIAICQALRENSGNRHIAIDPFQVVLYKYAGMRNLERAGLADLAELYLQKSHLILPILLQKRQVFDFIFIDGSHLFDYVMIDFFYSSYLIPVNGLICMDDIDMPSVANALAFIKSNLKNFSVVEQTERFCVLRKVVGDDRRLWYHFKPFTGMSKDGEQYYQDYLNS